MGRSIDLYWLVKIERTFNRRSTEVKCWKCNVAVFQAGPGPWVPHISDIVVRERVPCHQHALICTCTLCNGKKRSWIPQIFTKSGESICLLPSLGYWNWKFIWKAWRLVAPNKYVVMLWLHSCYHVGSFIPRNIDTFSEFRVEFERTFCGYILVV